MNIELTEQEAKNLLLMVNVASSIVGYTNDYLDEPQVAARARAWGKLENTLLQKAHEAGWTELVEKDEFGYHLNNTDFERNMTITDMYDDVSMRNDLSKHLARRDFNETYSNVEIEQMAKKNQGYFGVEMHSFEERYWNEFEMHEYNRLRIDAQD